MATLNRSVSGEGCGARGQIGKDREIGGEADEAAMVIGHRSYREGEIEPRGWMEASPWTTDQ